MHICLTVWEVSGPQICPPRGRLRHTLTCLIACSELFPFSLHRKDVRVHTLTDLYVRLFISWHLSEAERRDVAPQSEGLGDPPACVAGVYQVCGEGEQPAESPRTRPGYISSDVHRCSRVFNNGFKSLIKSWCVRLCKTENSRDEEVT